MDRFARLILAHTRLVALAWLAVAIVALFSVSSANNALSNTFTLPGQPAFVANQAILQTYGNGGDNPPTVLVATLPAGTTVGSPGVRAQLGAALAHVQATVPHLRVVSYASTGNRLFVSADGRTTFALAYTPVNPATGDTLQAESAIAAALAHTTIAGAPIHVTGLDQLAGGGSSGGNSALVETMLGGLGALIILAIVFGSLLAAVPLVMAFVSIPTTFLIIWGLTRITDISVIVQYLVSLIGLGLAIDYSLLIVMRWREERARGLDNRAAVQRALETAGTAVVFSGTTVGIGLLALVVLPVPFMRSIGIGGLLIPLVTVLVATTLLPSVLAMVGQRIDWPHRKLARTSRFWEGWGRLVVRFRWQAAVAAIAVLAAVIVPAFSLTLGFPKSDSLAQSGDAYVGLQALDQSGIGPGALYPIEILVRNADPQAVATQMAHVAGIRGAIAPAAWRQGQTALVDVLPTADGTSSSATTALDRVRQLAQGMPGSVQVGGGAAGNEDFHSAIYGSFPLMIALLCLLTFLLLARAFRSLLLPLKAVGLVLVSVGAAMGFMSFVWQQGHGSNLLFGVPATGSITLWIPVMVFAFLFGISMDYEVFLLARMREEYDATGSTTTAVVRGIGRTGRLVTSAALILFLAFMALASGPNVSVKIIATGLAAGILLDATVIRMLLVPALVSLFGRWNWWLPVPMARMLGVRTAAVADAAEDEFVLERTA